MDFKDAVKAAKQHVIEIFDGENLSNVGLEEIEHDEVRHLWTVTIGFSRPWDNIGALSAIAGQKIPRSYKVVTIDDTDGKIRSISNRAGANAE
jgi:hypothetical protein